MTELSGSKRSGRIWWFDLVITMLGCCVLLFIIAPLAGLVLATKPGELTETAGDAEVIESIKLTLKAAFFATVVSAGAGIPLAFFFARKKFFGKSILSAIVDLPIIIPHSAAGLALFAVIGRDSVIGRVFGSSLIGTTAGISVAMAFISVPFLVNAARHAFEGVDEKLEKAARTLGASPCRVFFTISVPLAWRGILSDKILF